MKSFSPRVMLHLLFLSLASSAHAGGDKIGVMSSNASVTANGNAVAFAADFDGYFRIWTSDLTGRNLRRLSSTSTSSQQISHSEPAWSPDGRFIAYVSESEGKRDIWVMQADGGHPVRLTNSGGVNDQPSWAPDGSKIAYVSDKSGSRDIWMMNPDGSQPVRLTLSPNQENNPQFSPVGDRIVYSETGDASTIRVMNRDGSDARQITSGAFHDWEPHWGPQGIVFSSNRDRSGHWKLWVVQPDGSGLHRVADITGLDPKWLPDGRIAFTDEASESRALAVASVFDPQTGSKYPIVDVQGYLTSIDIRPNRATNNVNPRSNGKLQVAIISSPSFDATRRVALASLTFGRSGSEMSLVSCDKPSKDVNGDGIPDLLCRFRTATAAFTQASEVGVLRFIDSQGRPYEGRDTISIVPYDDPEDFK
jgi:Tol biopolymer transport system component